MANILTETLKLALEKAGMEQLPAEWDKVSKFNLCIAKRRSSEGEFYVLGRYDESKLCKYTVLQSFYPASHSGSATDIIYPLDADQQGDSVIPATPASIVYPVLNDFSEKIAWLKEKGVATHLIKKEETANDKIKAILVREQNIQQLNN